MPRAKKATARVVCPRWLGEDVDVDHGRLERLLSSLHRTDHSASVLHRICVVCAEHPTIDGAGISQIRDGRHEVLAASDEHSEQVELLQVTCGEGPCLEVMTSSRPCFEPDLASSRARGRWPGFASAASAHGVVSAFAFPLLAGGVAVGALDVYSAHGALRSEQREDALLLADLAALAVDHVDGAPSVDGVALFAEPIEPWAHPAIVHQASGMVSERLTIDTDEALLRLRAVAFVTGRRVADVADDVVNRRMRIESWVDDG